MSDQALTHRVDENGFLRILFGGGSQRVNLLNEEVLGEIGRLLDDAKRRDDVRAVMFASAKPKMFLAGMDVEQITQANDSFRVSEGARFGQSVFQRLADLGRPSACAINGSCLGGGTELALACTFRLAADDPKLRIGLPEVRLGIIPGFGGTQRLPRLIALAPALEMILTGRALPPQRARKLGLVDALVPAEYLERETVRLLERAVEQGVSSVVRSLKRPRSLIDRAVKEIGPLRRYALDQARKRAEKKAAPANYPAPFRAIEAVETALTQPLPQGLDFEARIIGELVSTPTAKNLIWLFKSHTALKGDNGGVRATPRKVKRIAVIGAGIMGGGIAQLAADSGIPVRLRDVSGDSILKALQTARAVWAKQVARRTISAAGLERKMAFIAPTLDDSGLTHVDLVVEAVVEDLSVKQQVLAAVEQRVADRAVFASNTSSLPISEIAAKAARPERVVGLHFFNPVHRMPLVEVIAGKHSSPEAVATAHALALRLGKAPVVVRDTPGFLVNRVLTLYLNEAIGLLAEGVRIETIDNAMTAFGMPVGPFALLDQVGLDTAKHVGDTLREAFGERIGGNEEILRAMVASGRLGQKNGKGFYRYRGGEKTVVDPAVYGLCGSPRPRELPPETLEERLVLAMINEASLCLEQRVAREPRDVDLAMVLGTGFPPFRGGLLRFADAKGIPIIADRLSRLADAHGERFRPVESMQQMVREQRRFYDAG